MRFYLPQKTQWKEIVPRLHAGAQQEDTNVGGPGQGDDGHRHRL